MNQEYYKTTQFFEGNECTSQSSYTYKKIFEIFPILAYVEQINLHFLSVILVIKTCLLIVLLMRSGNHN